MTDKERQMVDEARQILNRWLAHQYGNNLQYVKLREARDLLVAAAIANAHEKH